MIDQVQDDTRIMSLVKLALALPSEERASYLKSACSGNSELFGQVWNYVQAEERMKGFLLEPPCSAPASKEYHFRPGELLDARFRIVREVAQGGMGVVYEAVDEKLERRIALKCAKAGFRKRLPPEVRNASEIGHPNVCKIFEIHSAQTPTGEADFITMEFLDGETLATRLRRRPLPERDARVIALQLCAGLAEAHRKGVVHGDLKAANVILTKDAGGEPRAVITDFGMAHCSEAWLQAARLGAKGGTPGYMAPELWRGEEASATSDIYALGVILYEMIGGHKPHDMSAHFSNSASTEIMAHEPNPVVFWEERLTSKPPPLHSKWDSVLARCLDPDPARRFKGADEVIQALGPSHTWRWFLAAAAAAVLAVASGVITYEGATAPKETVRLAVLPFTADAETAPLAETLVRDASRQIATLKGSSTTGLQVIPLADTLRKKVDSIDKARTVLGATQMLHGRIEKDGDNLTLRIFLTDTRSGVNKKEWKAKYARGELRYAPVAMAGLVTGAFHLPALATKVMVNAAARKDYWDAQYCLRRDSTVDKALALMERAVAADPESPLTYAGLAEAQWFKYFRTKDRAWLGPSAESESQAERRNPDLAPVCRIAGMLHKEAGLYEMAAAEYRRAIELEPGDAENYRRLGQVYEHNNQIQDALGAFKTAVSLQPAYYRTHSELGAYYYDRGDFAGAVVPLKTAVDLAPNEPHVHFALGATYSNLGMYVDAERQLRLAIGLDETSNALHSLGLALMYQGRDGEAIPYFSRALRRHPKSYLSWMFLGIACRRTGQAEEATQANRHGQEVADEEMARNPRDGYVRSILGYFGAALGDRRRAESETAQAVALSPDDAETRWFAVLTYECLGLRESSLAILSHSSAQQLLDFSRWPDVADLGRDPRFLQLLATHQLK